MRACVRACVCIRSLIQFTDTACFRYFYAGAPLAVDGATVGTLCLIGARRPAGFRGIDDLRAYATRAEKALQRQHAANVGLGK